MLLVAFALAVPGAALNQAGADHGADNSAWIEQAGNGKGASVAAIENLHTRTVLHDDLSFRFPPGSDKGVLRPYPRPCLPQDEAAGRCSSTFRRYAAWGTTSSGIPDPTGADPIGEPVLHMTQSDDGVNWDRPIMATIEDPDGIDVPFVMSDVRHFDVVFTNASDFQFVIYFAHFNRNNPDSIYEASSLRRALSDDGVTWVENCPLINCPGLAQDAANPMVTGVMSAGFKRGSYGFTDVLWNPTGLTENTCGTADPDGTGPGVGHPFNCRFAAYYNATDGGLEYTGLAYSGNGVTWTGLAAPVLSPGAGAAWDNDAATMAKVLRRDAGTAPCGSLTCKTENMTMFYSGSQAPDNACMGGAAGCASLGTATSSGLRTPAGWIASPAYGIAMTKSVTNPATPRSFIEQFSVATPYSLWYPTPVDDGNSDHAKVYFSRNRNLPFTDTRARNTLIAYTAPAPGLGPSVRFSNPKNGSFYDKATNLSDLVLYVTDTLGANVGVDMNTFVLKLDGNPLLGYTMTDSLVTGLKHKAIEVRVPASLLQGISVGSHTLSVEVKDLDGVLANPSITFFVEDGPPVSVLSATPVGPRVYPSLLWGTGVFQGTVTEGSGLTAVAPGTKLLRVNVRITNPLGMVCNAVVPESGLEKTGPGLDANKKWRFTYSPSVNHRCPTPTSTPNLGTQYIADEATTLAFWAPPGTYTVSFLGEDIARNVEQPSVDNTRSITILT